MERYIIFQNRGQNIFSTKQKQAYYQDSLEEPLKFPWFLSGRKKNRPELLKKTKRFCLKVNIIKSLKKSKDNDCINNGLIYGTKTKWSTNTCYNINESWKHYSKWKLVNH